MYLLVYIYHNNIITWIALAKNVVLERMKDKWFSDDIQHTYMRYDVFSDSTET